MSDDRRGFLKKLFTGGAAATAAVVLPQAVQAQLEDKTLEQRKELLAGLVEAGYMREMTFLRWQCENKFITPAQLREMSGKQKVFRGKSYEMDLKDTKFFKDRERFNEDTELPSMKSAIETMYVDITDTKVANQFFREQDIVCDFGPQDWILDRMNRDLSKNFKRRQ